MPLGCTNQFGILRSRTNHRGCRLRNGKTRRSGMNRRCWRCAADSKQNCRTTRSEEHTSELQSPDHLVCRLLLEKKKKLLHAIRAPLILTHENWRMCPDLVTAQECHCT